MQLSALRRAWPSFDLGEYRPHPIAGTYSLFVYETLPPIPTDLDEEWQWLRAQPTVRASLADWFEPDRPKPDLGKLAHIHTQLNVSLPTAFMTFITSLELHQRVRSCTDCHLDVADRAIKTIGTHQGWLIHFLADSQWILHWYLHVNDMGEHCVLASRNAYGFAVEDFVAEIDPDIVDSGLKTEIDLLKEEFWYCAPTFTEFVCRFWLENEIWFALKWDKRPLTPLEQAYVNHYLR